MYIFSVLLKKSVPKKIDHLSIYTKVAQDGRLAGCSLLLRSTTITETAVQADFVPGEQEVSGGRRYQLLPPTAPCGTSLNYAAGKL